MTLAQAITMTLNRVGLLTTNTTYKDQARLYLNMAAKRVSGEIGGKWWWLHKTTTFNTTKTLTVTSISGTFQAGEIVELIADTTIIGTIDADYDATNYPPALLLSSVTGTWVAGAMRGRTSSATATAVSIAVTQTYALDADVLVPHSFGDETNSRTISGAGLDMIDAEDPDRNNETNARIWAADGVDALSGKIRVRMWPYHSTPGDVIRYRYRGFIVDWTSGNDSTELDRWLPEILQPAVIFGATEMYLQEKGDSEAAGENRFEYNEAIDNGKETNRTIYGNRVWRKAEVGDLSGRFNYVPADGSLSAAS